MADIGTPWLMVRHLGFYMYWLPWCGQCDVKRQQIEQRETNALTALVLGVSESLQKTKFPVS